MGGSGCRCMHSGPPRVLRGCRRVRSVIIGHAIGVLPLRVPIPIWRTERHYWDGSWPRLRNQDDLCAAHLCMHVGWACCSQTALYRS